jgi:putative ABC transport system permease protein
MILLESIFYSLKSLFFGIILGIGGSYLIYKAFTNSMDSGYILPLKAIIISIIFITVLVYIIMKYSLDKTNKQNIIETIRKENI